MFQRARDPDALARRSRVESDPPGQPRRAGAEAIVPAAAGVELSDEVEEAGRGGIEMRRQLGDLVAQTIEVLRSVLHDESPFGGATLHPSFEATWEARRAASAADASVFA